MATNCPKCQTENPDTLKFCGECGTQLPLSSQPPAVTKSLESPAYALIKGNLVAGKYRVIEEIGRGGMGIVYEAEDIKLARKVAIKILPEAFTSDPERLARFEREARVLATLNHPNIAAIYGVEEADGHRFLVLELVEGETLADRLSKSPLPLEEALEACLQIAEGLEGAHEKNIIHRDLKPSNVKITPDGKVKILDFGLARAFHDQISEVDLAKSPTITADMTRPGIILGTAAYMSPEQAKGRAVDKRADIWAFGCILFEMLTGQPAFPGKDVTEIMAAVIRAEPEWSSLPPNLNWRLQELLERCLKKDLRDRYHDISDVRVDIQKILTDPGGVTVQPVTTGRPPRRSWLLWLYRAGAGVILLGIGLIVGSKILPRRVEKEQAQAVQMFNIQLQKEAPLAPVGSAPLGVGRPALALAPDGSHLVYVGEYEGETALYLRPLESERAQALPGTEGAYGPFFSPDGIWVGFFSGNQLKKTAVAGGQPITLCEATNTYGATWAEDGTIYFARNEGTQLSKISSEGGVPETVVVADQSKGIPRIRWPECLPGGKAILFSDGIVSPATHDLRALSGITNPRYLSTGHLLYSRSGGLMAVSFDLERLEVIGEPVPVLDGIRTETFGAAQYAISNNGLLIFVPGESAAVSRPVWVDRNGKVETLPFRPERYGHLNISPDGRKFAVSVLGKTSHIWIFDLVGKGEPQRFSTEENEHNPVWSPDGTRLAFDGPENGNWAIFWRPADRSSERQRLVVRDNRITPFSWSPDGQLLAILYESTSGGYDIYIFNLKTRELQPYLASRFNEWGPAFSPDGRWIAYTSDESGQYEVYVQSWPLTKGKWQVSTTAGGNEEPVWSEDGRELFYRNGRRWMAVPIITSPTFSSGAPQLLFQGDYINVAGMEYGVSPDGKRFLVLQPTDSSPPIELRVVVNWFEELKRLVPTGKK